MTRSLRLRREAMSDLSAEELGGVAGGNQYSGNAITCGLRDCVTEMVDISPLTRQTLDSRYCYTFPYC